jgi:hypothetical protein
MIDQEEASDTLLPHSGQDGTLLSGDSHQSIDRGHPSGQEAGTVDHGHRDGKDAGGFPNLLEALGIGVELAGREAAASNSIFGS